LIRDLRESFEPISVIHERLRREVWRYSQDHIPHIAPPDGYDISTIGKTLEVRDRGWEIANAPEGNAGSSMSSLTIPHYDGYNSDEEACSFLDGYVSDDEGDPADGRISPCTFLYLAEGAKRWDADGPFHKFQGAKVSGSEPLARLWQCQNPLS
jgi:hypothetical protein